MKLLSIPKEKYNEYKLDLMFDAYKWDPQFVDNNTIAKYVLILSEKENKELIEYTEQLDMETRMAEEFLNNNLEDAKILKLPRKIKKKNKKIRDYEKEKHIRLMRFDFHKTTENKWVISEVNSDVPGGFAESSIMPQIAMNLLEKNKYWYKNFGDCLTKEISNKVKKNGTIALVHCTSYSDDRQVMEFLGDKLKSLGFNIIYVAADHLRFKNKEAYSILDGNNGKIDGIFRFTPLEWLINIKPKYWDGYFDTITTSCNHPIAIFAQTKRFPLCWDILEKNGVRLEKWRKLLTETIEVKDFKNKNGYIYKPAC